MPVNQPSRQELDARVKELTNAVRTALDNVYDFKLFLDTIPDATLTGAGQGFEYSAQDLANVRSAVAALAQLRVVANAGATVTAVDDFFFFAKRVWGYSPARR